MHTHTHTHTHTRVRTRTRISPGPTCTAYMSLISYFLSPWSWFLVDLELFCLLPAPLLWCLCHSISDSPLPKRSGSCSSFSVVTVYLEIFYWVFLKFLQPEVPTVLCILPVPRGRSAIHLPHLSDLVKLTRSPKCPSAGGLAWRQDFVDCSPVCGLMFTGPTFTNG